MRKKLPLNKLNTFYLLGAPLAALFLVPWSIMEYGLPLWAVVLCGVYYFITGNSITMGYHRLFSHRTYDAKPVVKIPLLLFGAGALQNSALKWSADHRIHHRYVDTEKDPYNIQEGFFWAHMGWVFYEDESKQHQEFPKDLLQDPYVMWQHKYYLWIALFMCFGVPTLVGYFFGNAVLGLIFGGLLRVLLTTHSTFLINSAAHTFGKQTYTDENSARDHGLLAFFSFGEGYHNFHHLFASDYRNGVRWFQFDPGKWGIWLCSHLGLASNLKRVSDKLILEARLRMEEKRLKLQGRNVEYLAEAKAKLILAHERFLEMKKHYRTQTSLAKQNAKNRLREQKEEFRLAYRNWKGQVRDLKRQRVFA